MSTVLSPEDLRRHAERLREVSEELLASNDPRWLPVSQAAALVDAFRLGLVLVEGVEDAPEFEWSLEHA